MSHRILLCVCVCVCVCVLGLKRFLEINSNTKNNWGKLCASRNRFVHLLGMHWIVGSQKYMRRRTTQQCSGLPSPSAVITAPCDAPLYHSAQLPLMLTGKAESAQITRRQERSM